MLSNGKRLYAAEFKAELVRQFLVPGTSVAATGMAHGISANLLRRWIVLDGGCVAASALALLPVTELMNSGETSTA
ncbi:MAG: transposase [Variovorax sp.]